MWYYTRAQPKEYRCSICAAIDEQSNEDIVRHSDLPPLFGRLFVDDKRS
jgi:hypothetical protein